MPERNDTSSQLRPVHRAIRRVRRRLRAWSVLDRVVSAGAIAAAAAMIGLYLLKLEWLPADLLWTVPATALAIVLAGLVWGLVTRVSDIAAAKRLDDSAGLADRLGSAVAFDRLAEKSAFHEAAMADAAAHAHRADPKAAAPFYRPRDLALLGLTLLGLGAAWLFDPPLPHHDRFGVARATPLELPREPKPRMSDEEKQELAKALEELEELAKALEESEESEAKDWLSALRDLVEDVQEGRITAAEAIRRLAELDKDARAFEQTEAAKLEAIRERMKEAAEKLADKGPAGDLKDALEKGDLDKAAKELEKLAAEDKLNKRDRDKLAKQLQEMAKAMERDPVKRMEELQKEIDRLQKKKEKEKDRFAKREEDRLAQKKKQLEQLQRDQQEDRLAKSEKTLDRLTRDLQQAADELLRQQKGEGGKGDQDAMSRAADEMRRLSKQQAQRQAMKAGRARMVDVREMMRRAQQGQGQGDGGEDGEDRLGLGRKGKEKGNKGKLEDFYARAGGEKKPGKKGKGGEDRLLVGESEGEGDGQMMVGEGQGKEQQGTEVESSSNAPGDTHDPNLLGKGTKMNSRRKDSFVAGQKQEGESRSETIYGAAERGFSGTSYRKVHHDYSGVVEEDMEKEQIPKGYRRYVERYFDLIRPR